MDVHDELEHHPRQLAFFTLVFAHSAGGDILVHEHLEAPTACPGAGVRLSLDKPFSQPSPQQPLPPDRMVTWSRNFTIVEKVHADKNFSIFKVSSTWRYQVCH